MNDKALHEMNENFKTIKLIDRLYNGDRLNEKQVNSIWDLVHKKGRATTRPITYRIPVYDDGPYPIKFDTEIVDKPGYFYLGLFCQEDSLVPNGREIIWMNVRTKEFNSLTIYKDGIVRYS